jgi:hypothetical protein
MQWNILTCFIFLGDNGAAFILGADGCSAILGSASNGSAGVRDETSESQHKNARETEDAGSLPQPPFDDGASALDCHQTRQSRRYPGDQDEVAQDAERLWRAGNRCHRNQDETKGDSDRGDDVERAGSDGVFSDPDKGRGRDDADCADDDDEQADHEG